MTGHQSFRLQHTKGKWDQNPSSCVPHTNNQSKNQIATCLGVIPLVALTRDCAAAGAAGSFRSVAGSGALTVTVEPSATGPVARDGPPPKKNRVRSATSCTLLPANSALVRKTPGVDPLVALTRDCAAAGAAGSLRSVAGSGALTVTVEPSATDPVSRDGSPKNRDRFATSCTLLPANSDLMHSTPGVAPLVAPTRDWAVAGASGSFCRTAVPPAEPPVE